MAKNNVLTMNEEEIQIAASGYRECSTGLGDAGSKIISDFQSAMNCGLMTKSVSEISKQLKLLSGSIGNVQNIMNKQSSKMFDFDKTIAQQADAIEIPDDFFSNNAMQTNEYNRSILGKIDGTSVNEGQTAVQFNEIDDNTVSAQSLADISGDQTKQQEYDETTVIGKSVLGNISADQTKEQNYDDSSSLNKATINDISGDQTKQQEYDETTVLGKSVLGNINKNETLDQKELDNASSISATNLENVNKSKAASINDELVFGTQAMSSSTAMSNVQAYKNQEKEEKEEQELRKIDDKFNEISKMS